MKFLTNANFQVFLTTIILVITILILFSTVSVMLNEKLYLKLDSTGFNNIFVIFKFPITLIAALLAILTLKVTLLRAIQYEKQLEIVTDNNLFNNYYKHLQEFIDFFKDFALFKVLQSKHGLEPKMALTPLYKYYYSDNYKIFTIRLSDEIKNKIKKYYIEVNNLKLNNEKFNLLTANINELKKLSELNNQILKELISPLSQYFQHSLISDLQGSISFEFLSLLNEVYWTNSFIEGLIAFDGQPKVIIENFALNYERLFDKIGKPKP